MIKFKTIIDNDPFVTNIQLFWEDLEYTIQFFPMEGYGSLWRDHQRLDEIHQTHVNKRTLKDTLENIEFTITPIDGKRFTVETNYKQSIATIGEAI